MKGKTFLKGFDLIRHPVVTEKSNRIAEINQYMFVVRNDASKPLLKRAFEEVFDVKVKSVNTFVRKGKTRVFRGRKGTLSDTKRAIFTLEPGQNLDMLEGEV